METEKKDTRLSPVMIKKLRAKLNVTQSEFGELVGVSKCTVYWWEIGKYIPSEENRQLIIDLRKVGRRDVKKVLKEMNNSGILQRSGS